jgi:hypothetical protein
MSEHGEVSMKMLYCLGLLLLVSCGTKKHNVKFGETTKADLIQLRGEPLREESIPVKDSSLLVYSENESYQIQNGVVSASLKSASSEEKSVQFWKHKLKDCKTRLNKIESKNSHRPAQMELDCPEEGIKVVYMDGSATVSTVVEYAKE